MITGSSPGSGSSQVCICVNGCQTCARSSAVRRWWRASASSGAVGMSLIAAVLARGAQGGEGVVDVLLSVRGRQNETDSAGAGRDSGRADGLGENAVFAQAVCDAEGVVGGAEEKWQK